MRGAPCVPKEQFFFVKLRIELQSGTELHPRENPRVFATLRNCKVNVSCINGR